MSLKMTGRKNSMNNLECESCKKILNPKIVLNFFSESLKAAKSGSKEPVQFHIQADCRGCGKFIKFLPRDEWLQVIHKKEISV